MKVFQKAFDLFRRFGHSFLKFIFGMSFKTQQMCFFNPKFNNPADNIVVVIFIGMVSP